jgi:hypothetical protein
MSHRRGSIAVMDHDDRPEQPDRDPAGDPDLPAGSEPGD